MASESGAGMFSAPKMAAENADGLSPFTLPRHHMNGRAIISTRRFDQTPMETFSTK